MLCLYLSFYLIWYFLTKIQRMFLRFNVEDKTLQQCTIKLKHINFDVRICKKVIFIVYINYLY